MRDHGMSKERRYWHTDIGYNYRMTNLQAAIGVAQLEQFESILSRKKNLAMLYRKYLGSIEGLSLPPAIDGAESIYWLYTVLLDEGVFGKRDRVIEKLAALGIQSRPMFYPLHQMPPYQRYGKSSGFSVSERISRQGISLPSSAELTEDQIIHIAESLRKIPSFLKMVKGI